jgi:hypothetical protein
MNENAQDESTVTGKALGNIALIAGSVAALAYGGTKGVKAARAIGEKMESGSTRMRAEAMKIVKQKEAGESFGGSVAHSVKDIKNNIVSDFKAKNQEAYDKVFGESNKKAEAEARKKTAEANKKAAEEAAKKRAEEKANNKKPWEEESGHSKSKWRQFARDNLHTDANTSADAIRKSKEMFSPHQEGPDIKTRLEQYKQQKAQTPEGQAKIKRQEEAAKFEQNKQQMKDQFNNIISHSELDDDSIANNVHISSQQRGTPSSKKRKRK